MTSDPRVRRRRVVLVAAECLLVLVLLGAWLASETMRDSQSLVVLFLYSFPSEFLVGLVPHEPVLILFGVSHPAWIVALVAGVSTVLAERMNYSVFSLFYEASALRSASKHRTVAAIMELFGRRPFAAILAAGFTPVPFFPIRFLVVMTGYPVRSYLWGVFLSRTPRFWILAALGAWLEIPTELIGALFLVMLLSANVPLLVKLVRGNGEPTTVSETGAEDGPPGGFGEEAVDRVDEGAEVTAVGNTVAGAAGRHGGRPD